MNPGRVEHLGSEIATEETPIGAVGGRANIVLVAIDDFTGSECVRAVGENGAVLN